MLNCPAERIYGNNTELIVRTFGRFNTEEEFNNIIVSNVNGSDVRLSEVADVVLGPENEETGLKESGIPMIALAIIPQPDLTYVAISDEFYKRLHALEGRCGGCTLNIALDQTKYIKKIDIRVTETLIIALILVILII
jgi:multidrug efflux pump